MLFVRLLVLLVAVWTGSAQAAGNAACAPCHRAIFDSYQKTAMARSSGRPDAAESFESFARPAFPHSPSGFRYRVSRANGRYFVEFDREGAAELRGKKELAWFIGSG